MAVLEDTEFAATEEHTECTPTLRSIPLWPMKSFYKTMKSGHTEKVGELQELFRS